MPIYEKVKAIIIECLGLDEDEIKDDSLFVDDLGADSLDIVDITSALEEEFGFEIPEDDIRTIKSLGEVVKYIHYRLNTAS